MSGGQTLGNDKTKQGCGSTDSTFISMENANKCEEPFEDASLLKFPWTTKKKVRDFIFSGQCNKTFQLDRTT